MKGKPSLKNRERAMQLVRDKLANTRRENSLLRRYVAALEALAVRSVDNDPKTIRRIVRLKKGVAL